MITPALPREEIRVALIGAGSIGRVHFQALKEFAKVPVVGVVDDNAALRERFAADGVPAYASLSELHAAQAPNAVVIATPPHVRLAIAQEAFALGLHQLHEKPLGFDLAQAEAIRDLAKQHPELVVAVGYCHHYVAAVRKCREWIEQGALGKLCWINVDFVGRQEGVENHWFLDPAVAGGGSCLGVTCHSVDLFLHLVGAVESVSGCLQYEFPGRAESSDALVLQSRSGVLGTLKSSYTSSLGRAAFEIVGTEATALFDYADPERLRKIGRDGQEVSETVENALYRFVRQDEAWINTIAGTPDPCLADVDRGVEVARLIESVYRNARSAVS